jgi:N-acyl-D-amino-acid deacylase
MHDLTIIGGVVHDGLGSPGRRADVAIDAARVTAVGQFELAHRGTLQPGSIADICVFDPETIAHPGSYAEPDVSPVGIDHVVLGGTVVVDDGAFTGVRAGVVLRAGSG